MEKVCITRFSELLFMDGFGERIYIAFGETNGTRVEQR